MSGSETGSTPLLLLGEKGVAIVPMPVHMMLDVVGCDSWATKACRRLPARGLDGSEGDLELASGEFASEAG